ncbi:hypothetical protein, partial [Paenisporosarcina sp. TG-14]|uniref:hypothetical protein n=1 Tax=Paenisporosarcina sp. TG-14 TaxID=1231057 RepID=UPI00056AAB54
MQKQKQKQKQKQMDAFRGHGFRPPRREKYAPVGSSARAFPAILHSKQLKLHVKIPDPVKCLK